ncbi:hypothetical protein, partial [Kribbella albertanoniae]|uniref:hypothetical protein n=1 Tax=Kribbella albertanoniae TaxID=1266829 RepID=UPI001EE01C02
MPPAVRASGRPSASTAVLSAAWRGRRFAAALLSRIAAVRGPDSSLLPRAVRGSATDAAGGCAYDGLGVAAVDSNGSDRFAGDPSLPDSVPTDAAGVDPSRLDSVPKDAVGVESYRLDGTGTVSLQADATGVLGSVR